MISSYYFKGTPDDPWEFEKVKLGTINLFVGGSGSGKTRFLNTVFNFSSTVAMGQPFRSGYWEIEIKTDDYFYQWQFEAIGKESGDSDNHIKFELLKRKKIDAQDSEYEILIERTPDEFKFCGSKLPKLEKDKPSVTLLKEEEKIQSLWSTFAKIQRRNFHDEGLKDALAIQNIPQKLLEEIENKGVLEFLRGSENAVNVKMFLLKKNKPEIYKMAVNTFKQVFPSINDCDVQTMSNPPVNISAEGIVPIFTIKEKSVDKWIPLNVLSSGMQKVLLIITDILTLPKGSIYIIDEYENSLGVNAIDFLPQFIIDNAEDIQFLITTHHPYLINSMPMSHWRVFHRDGSNVSIKDGKEYEEKYGKSKQKAFIQLINDPFYAGSGA